MSKFTLLDCDNVLSNDAWRVPLIRWDRHDMNERYRGYHQASAFDAPGNRHLLKNLRAEDVLIFTAMPEEYRVLRQLWFNHNRIGFNKIYMRPEGNHLHSVELKRWMLYEAFANFGIGPDGIAAAYDDRPDVVQMYQDEGINGVLISIHNVCAYTAPKLEKQL